MQIKLIYYSFFLELLSFLGFFKIFSIYGLIFVMFTHGMALFLICNVWVSLMPKRFSKKRRIEAILFFFVLAYPTLYIGYVSIFIFVIYILRKQKDAEFKPLEGFSFEDLLYDYVLTEGVKQPQRKYGEAFISALSKGSMGGSEKNYAVLSTMGVNDPIITSIIKDLLSSTQDEIRLYAFSMFSKMEKEFYDNIFHLKKKLEDSKLTNTEKAKILYELAYTYYTMVHLNIVGEEFRDFLIQQALEYATSSLNLEESPETSLLISRIYLNLGITEKAYEYIIKIQDPKLLNSPEYILHYAELMYKRKKYKEVRDIFRKNKDLYFLNEPMIHFIVEFWLGDEGAN